MYICHRNYILNTIMIAIFDTITHDLKLFHSKTTAGKYINISAHSIRFLIKTKKHHKKQFYVFESEPAAEKNKRRSNNFR
jgi:hypothetical protein